ncbi:MAG: hypothetical protein U0931_06465 [Vulcanimicrobiota bacterium]
MIEHMGDETLVYCEHAKKAFCLNPVCARVFQLCDGHHSLSQMATKLEVSEASVVNGLAVLQEHDLLEPIENLKRRELLKGVAVLLPAVLAVSAPEPSMAASAAGGCITNIQCGAKVGFVNSCQPCDEFNTTPTPNCANPKSFCMSTWKVNVDAGGDPIPGQTCANDIYQPGFVNQCENANANNIWAMDCDAARAAVIAARPPKPQSISNYKCCHCTGR